MLVEGLEAYLAANAGLQALLGTPQSRADQTTGVFPVLAPERTVLPYVTMEQVGGLEDNVFEGTNRTQSARWRFSCYGNPYLSASKVAKVLKRAMRNCVGDLPAGNARVLNSTLAMEASGAEPIARGLLYAVYCDFEILFTDNDNT